jgi:hypothetical protein
MMFNMEAKSSGNRARAAVWGANKLGVVLGAALVSVVIIVPVVLLLAPASIMDAVRLPAVLAFVAALAGTVVAAFSLIAGRQNEDRLAKEWKEETARLKVDAAMRAGQLFAGPAGGQATPAASASGLLALSELGQPDLAVALLVDLWAARQGGVCNEIAILVVDKALRSQNPSAQLIAAELLCRHSAGLNAAQSLDWPSAIEGCWLPDLSSRAKLLLVEALIRMTIGKLPGDADGVEKLATEPALRAVAVRLYGIWRYDPDVTVKGCIAKLLSAVIDRLADFKYTDLVQGNQTVLLSDLKDAAKQQADNPDAYLNRTSTQLAKALKAWADRCELSSGPGSLAASVVGTDGGQLVSAAARRPPRNGSD